MGRKIPFLISTLITAASSLGALSFGVTPVSAEKLTIDGADYWTLDEVQVESAEYLKDVAKCNDDEECKSFLEAAYLMAGGKYSAGAAFARYYFLVTGINPSKSTISVYFNDESAKEYAFPKTDELDVLKNLYFFSWEDGGQPDFTPEGFKDTTSLGRREIYTGIAGSDEPLLPAGVEYELKVSDFDLTFLEEHPLYYLVESKLSNSLTERHYESCLKEIHGLENYECRIAMDEMGNVTLYPTEVKQAEPEAPTETEEVPTEEVPSKETTVEETPSATTSVNATSVTTPTPVISTSVIRVPEYVTEVRTATKQTESNNREEQTLAKLADSAESASSEKNEDHNQDNYVEVPLAASKKDAAFPWWLLIFAFSGVAVIVFWFMLIRNRMNEE